MHQQSTEFNKHLLGVYGTLRFGGSNHRNYLQDATYLKNTKVPGVLFDINGYYPAAVWAEQIPLTHPAKTFIESHTFVVEIYELIEKNLHKIDGLEGHPTYYKRTLVPVPGLGHMWLYLQPWDWLLRGEQLFAQSGDWHQNTKLNPVFFGETGHEKPRLIIGGKAAVVGKSAPARELPNSPFFSDDATDEIDEFEIWAQASSSSPVVVPPPQTEVLKIELEDVIKEA